MHDELVNRILVPAPRDGVKTVLAFFGLNALKFLQGSVFMLIVNKLHTVPTEAGTGFAICKLQA